MVSHKPYIAISILFVGVSAYAENVSVNLDTITVNHLKEAQDGIISNPYIASGIDLDAQGIRHERRETLGDTLSRQSGVQTESYGAASGKPVIRAYNSERVGVFNAGISANGSAGISTNYPLGLSTSTIRSVNVVKTGAATRYGGDAIGGAVNVDDGLISTEHLDKPFTGNIELGGGMNTPMRLNMRLSGQVAQHWAWQLQVGKQHRKHTRIPGHSKAAVCSDTQIMAHNAVAQHLCQVDVPHTLDQNPAWYPYVKKEFVDHPERIRSGVNVYTKEQWGYLSEAPYFYKNVPNPQYDPAVHSDPDPLKAYVVHYAKPVHTVPDIVGRLPNGHITEKHFNFGTSYIGERFYIGAALRHQTQFYGVPGFSFALTNTGADIFAPIDIKGQLQQFQLKGSIDLGQGLWRKASFNMAQTHQKTDERLGGLVSTQLDEHSREGRFILDYGHGNHWQGQIGADITARSVKTSGPDRYLPNVSLHQRGLFLLQQYQNEWLFAEAGYRHEWVRYTPDAKGYQPARNAVRGFKKRKFGLNQYHASLSVMPSAHWTLGYHYTHGERAPAFNALYGSNQHMAILSIESGDPNLKAEKATTHELSAQYSLEPVDVKLSYYKTDYKDYIYLGYTTGFNIRQEDLRQWRQSHHKVSGLEGEIALNWQHRSGDWRWRIFGDIVRNHIVNPYKHFENGVVVALPLSRYGSTLDWKHNQWSANLSLTHYLKPHQLGAHNTDELPLPSYTLLDGRVGYLWQRQNGDELEVFLEGHNLTNTEARAHNSPVKYLAPLPGRSLFLGANYHF